MSARWPRRLLTALLVAAVVVAGVGCAKAAAPSQAEYAAAADQVCESTRQRLEELEEAHDVELFEAASGGDSGVYVDRPERWVRAKIVPEYKRMAGGLKGIQPPDGDAAYLADIYADLDARIAVLHNQPSDGRGVVDDDTGLRQRFEDYGMKKCPPSGADDEEGTDGEGE